MGNTISIAADPDEIEPRGAADPLMSSPLPARLPITSAPSSDDSFGLLGTPQERLGILRTEIRNAQRAGMPLKFDFVRLPSGGNALMIVVAGAVRCPHCDWWNLEAVCANETCPGRAN